MQIRAAREDNSLYLLPSTIPLSNSEATNIAQKNLSKAINEAPTAIFIQ